MATSKNKRKFSNFELVLKWSIVVIVGIILFLAVVVIYYSTDLPSTAKLEENNRIPDIKIVNLDGQLVANYGEAHGATLQYQDFSPYLIQAVISTEDRRFFEHFGIDLIGLVRAASVNFIAHRVVQGGSTITQQLAKIVFFSPERTMKRKIQEMILALWLEHKYSKQEILSMYLNRVYLGGGNFGVDAAAHNFFSKSASELSLSEAAVLAGLIRAPSRYSPTSNPELSAQRAKQVLANMVDAGYISLEKAVEAEKDLKHEAQVTSSNMYFAEWIAEQVPLYLGVQVSDIIVKTTLDLRMQKAAEEAIKKSLDENGEKLKIGQGALVSLANDGRILAMVGGKNYKASPFNRATQAQRQPGSSFKLFVYLAAFEHGLAPDSTMIDQPVEIEDWAPENYEQKFLGEVTLSEAFALSLNSIAVQLGQTVGIDHVIEMAQRLGIASKLMEIPSAALGTNEVNLLELTQAYAAVANNGYKVKAYGIEEIDNTSGVVLYKHEPQEPEQVLEKNTVYKINSVLSDVVNRGTGQAAKLGDRPAAGKTGTSQDYRDAWFMGFTPQITTGVWVGNDDDTPMKKVTGGKIAAPIWKEYMTVAMEGLPVEEIPTTAGFLRELMPSTPYEPATGTAPTAAPPQYQHKSFWDKLFGR